ncbi:ubiquinone biosynthesis protein [Streptomyces sp. DSM 42143]|uniref:ABC1 kinase family protein n=1 Tax=Streptomyces TaxID=1883 RepID=UPI00211C901B|nr:MULTISPECIES: AarF/UbiB family protein [unclassified Streptomyces]MDN3248008.1 AarF/UbiB family protein [Streptomyces sp. ZSW22]MDN3256206.1 AarF/UbiB family protein [Streptomyces sp. MA25(2023)]MDQ0389920.1 ubiquinone biosynthesis protein [Streptomyces sp. DSM 42143]
MSAGRGRVLMRVLAHLIRQEATLATTPAGRADEGAVRRARNVRRALESLGPFYVKVGQMLATRPDIVTPQMIDEFEKLQDEASPAPFGDFEPVLRRELGPGWAGRFSDFDTEHPLGTASLAQVYRAELPNGRPVAVKIQRPGVRETVEADMKLMGTLSRFASRRTWRFNEVIDVEAMLKVVFDAMRPELDFVMEARNMTEAAKAAEDFDYVAVPEVIEATGRVLVQGLAPGSPIREADKDRFGAEERRAIGQDLLAFMYRGYFVDRIFHADPHPGNIFVEPGHPATVIDWGMVGRIDRPMSTSILLMLLNLAMNDGAGTARAWVDMGSATSWANTAAFAGDMASLVPQIATASLEELNFGVTLTAVLQHSTRRGIRTSPMVSILGKSFANIEGSIRHLCPELSLIDVFSEELVGIVTDLVKESLSPQQAVRTALEVITAGAAAPQQLRGITKDLSNRDLTMRMNLNGHRAATRSSGLRKGAAEVSLALATTMLWNHYAKER